MSRQLFVVAAVLVAAVTADAGAQVGRNTDVLNPNLAGADELALLPHIDLTLAETIVEHRPFLDILALDALLAETLGDEARSEVYERLFVPINLNTATRAEILLVPRVGPRMAHEFEEYRPYRGLPRFRREIAKYVDEIELARLEQFVFVPIDLNSARDDDILSIPGVGSRMLHEFKEYRPYRAIAQLRREIGKYVNDQELARLERYVIIREN